MAHNRFTFLIVIAVAGAVLVGWRGLGLVTTNATQIALVRDLSAGGELRPGSETAWDDGWRSLCAPLVRPNGSLTDTTRINLQLATMSTFVQAQIDRGRYDAALAALDQAESQGWSAQAYNAAAYRAALQRQWTEAARLYQPEKTPRQQRWWGTIFYLAAQEQWFKGDAAGAAPFYRQADALYSAQGPYMGLELVECLIQDGRRVEAFDALRRALVVLPVDEALAHRAEFDTLRLSALQDWQARHPTNEQVQAWRRFYQAADQADRTEVVADELDPQVKLAADLSEGRKLLGFEYHAEDIETGPFLTVDFYVQDDAQVTRQRRTVLNQAANGAFAWDAVPDGVKPLGWHGYVYEPNPIALTREKIDAGAEWLCLDAGRLDASYGAQSLTAKVTGGASYVQGGQGYLTGPDSLSLGRAWFGTGEAYNYSYASGGRAPNQIEQLSGVWDVPQAATGAAVWLLAHQVSRGCFNHLYFFAVPTFEH